jgi:hypothetical protein
MKQIPRDSYDQSRDPIVSADFGAEKPKGANGPDDLRATVSDTIMGAGLLWRCARGRKASESGKGTPRAA